MAVRASDGQIPRIQQLSREAGMTEDFFLVALQSVCDFIGCYRLTMLIPQVRFKRDIYISIRLNIPYTYLTISFM